MQREGGSRAATLPPQPLPPAPPAAAAAAAAAGTAASTAQCGAAHHGDACGCASHAGAAAQSLDELAFTRSACHAAQLGQLERLERLLASRPGALSSDGGDGTTGYTPLHYAARAGQLGAVRLLLRRGAAVDAATRAGGATPLHRAAHTGHTDVVRELLAAGADALRQDADGEAPLHKAAAQGHAAAAAALLAAAPGAAALADKRGRTPQQRAAGDARTRVAWPPAVKGRGGEAADAGRDEEPPG